MEFLARASFRINLCVSNVTEVITNQKRTPMKKKTNREFLLQNKNRSTPDRAFSYKALVAILVALFYTMSSSA